MIKGWKAATAACLLLLILAGIRPASLVATRACSLQEPSGGQREAEGDQSEAGVEATLPRAALRAICGLLGEVEPRTGADGEKRSPELPKWTDEVQAWSAGAVALLTLVLLVINGFQFRFLVRSTRAAEHAANAARASVAAARESTEAQSRAWLSIGCVLGPPRIGRTHLGVDGLDIELKAETFNRGSSPALSVFFDAEIGLLSKGSPPPEEMLAACCDAARRRHGGGSLEAVFPSDRHEERHGLHLPLKRIEDDLAWREFKMIAPVVYGCFSYRSPYVEGVRQTRFLYQVTGLRNGEPVALKPDRADWLTQPMHLAGPGWIVAD